MQYVGQYRFVEEPEYGVEIEMEKDQLFLQELPDGIRFQLYPESECDFFCLSKPELITFFENDQGGFDTLLIGEYEQLQRME